MEQRSTQAAEFQEKRTDYKKKLQNRSSKFAKWMISFLSKSAPSVPYNADDIVVITHRVWNEEENRTGRVNPVCETKM